MKWAAAVMCRRNGRYVARSIQAVNQAGVVGLAKETTQTGLPATRPSRRR